MLWFCTNWWCQILVVRWNAVARRGLCEAVTFVVVSSNITTWTWRPRRSPSYHVDLAASSFSFYDEECCSEILCVGNYAIPPAKPVITKSRARDIISQLKSSWRSIQGHLRWRSIAQVSTSYQLLNLSKSINLENQHRGEGRKRDVRRSLISSELYRDNEGCARHGDKSENGSYSRIHWRLPKCVGH